MPGHVIWAFASVFYVTFVTLCLLSLASEKTLGRNWFACIALIIGMGLSFMLGKNI
jgi:hypothetical protein